MPSLLRDFDWKLLFVVASDQCAAIRAPLLRLQLCLAGALRGGSPSHPARSLTAGRPARRPDAAGSNAAVREVALELNAAQLDALIASLEGALQARTPESRRRATSASAGGGAARPAARIGGRRGAGTLPSRRGAVGGTPGGSAGAPGGRNSGAAGG
jgi:hypothetical protein